MEKQYAPSANDKKVSNKAAEVKAEAPKAADKKAEKAETKADVKKVEQKPVVKKDFAVVYGNDRSISKKHSMSIIKMIKGKTPDKAVEMLEEVILMKRAVPMNDREVPHRKGMMAGRYPINAAKEFINLVKQLKANSSVNGIDNPMISAAKADKASRPYRRGGVRAKRTHVFLEARAAKLK